MIRDLFRGFWGNLVRTFRGRSLWWQLFTIPLTAAIVLSDFDWTFYEHTRSTIFYPLVYFVGIGGFFVPVFVPLGIYIVGEMRKNRRLQFIGAAVAQAEIIGLGLTTFYKIFTGRIAPPYLGPISVPDTSKIFQFGLFRGGVFWGWPSSHAAVAFAGMTALALLARSKNTTAACFLYAFLVAAGAAIGFHWFSDVIAGTIIGIVTGASVAYGFQRHSYK